MSIAALVLLIVSLILIALGIGWGLTTDNGGPLLACAGIVLVLWIGFAVGHKAARSPALTTKGDTHEN